MKKSSFSFMLSSIFILGLSSCFCSENTPPTSRKNKSRPSAVSLQNKAHAQQVLLAFILGSITTKNFEDQKTQVRSPLMSKKEFKQKK